jgi:prepilin signal peptidase PulO-like enzyme (type II secretory pathway)
MLAIFTVLITAVIAAGVFACAAYLGIELSKIVIKASPSSERKEGGRSLSLTLVGSSAGCGLILALRGLAWQDLTMAAVMSIFLAACWHSAVATGKISDYFIFIPLSAILIADAAQQDYWLLLAPLIPFLPFAVAAYISKGENMGWDDAKLAALGGATLGAWYAVLAFATACIVAAIVARLRKKTREPILFAPYMIASLALYAIFTIARAN